jgi:PTS system sucrose-specific IIC component
MAEDKITRIANGIYDHVGGPENVAKIIHCMTRVRLTIRDQSKVDLDGLKQVDGVLGIVEEDTLQVVVGPGTVNKVAKVMVDRVGVQLGEPFPENKAAVDGSATGSGETLEEIAKKNKAQYKRKPNKFKSATKSLANIFVPLIPAMVGTGIIAGIASVLTNLVTASIIGGSTWTQVIAVMNTIYSGLLGYLVIYTGIQAAKEFGADQYLGGVIGAVVMLSGMDAKQPFMNFLTHQPLSPNQGGIIGVIFAVWLLAKLETWLHKWVPEAVDVILVPAFSLLVIGLIEIFGIMPIAGFISNSLVGTINGVLNLGGPVAGFVLAGCFLPMVMFGLHQVLTPIHIEMIQKTGSTKLLPILAMAGAGQVGAAAACYLYLRKKDPRMAKMIVGALPAGICGIGEPLIYGVTLPLGRPFITACLGGAIGGLVIGLLGNVGAVAQGPSGLALIPLIANGHWINYILGLLAAYISGFVLTLLFGLPKNYEPKK